MTVFIFVVAIFVLPALVVGYHLGVRTERRRHPHWR